MKGMLVAAGEEKNGCGAVKRAHRNTMSPNFMQLVVCARRIIVLIMLSLRWVCSVDVLRACLALKRDSRWLPSIFMMLPPSEIERSFVAMVSWSLAHPRGAAIAELSGCAAWMGWTGGNVEE